MGDKMTIEQISIFLENRPGAILEITKLIAEKNINLRAMSVAETANFGIIRVITSDSFETINTLRNAGYVCRITKVLAVSLTDSPGALNETLEVLYRENINIEYMYALMCREENRAVTIFKTPVVEDAAKILNENGVKLLSQDEMNVLFK